MLTVASLGVEFRTARNPNRIHRLTATGRIVARFDGDFVRQFARDRDARAIKTLPAFPALREDIRTGRTPSPGLREGIRTLEIVEQIYQTSGYPVSSAPV